MSDEAAELRQDYIDEKLEIVVPDLILNELGNALRYNPAFDSEDVENAIQSIFDMGFEILAPSPQILKETSRLSFDLETTFYDSIYLATAEVLGLEIITTDEELVRKFGRAKNLKNRKPEED